MSEMEWGDDLEDTYPITGDRCGVTIGVGYRWRDRYQVQATATVGASGTARGVNVPTANLITYSHRSRSMALLMGRRFGRVDGWVGGTAIVGSYDWSHPGSVGAQDRERFFLPGAVLEGTVRLFHLGPRVEVALNARYEAYPDLAVSGYAPAMSTADFPEARLNLSRLHFGVRLNVLR